MSGESAPQARIDRAAQLDANPPDRASSWSVLPDRPGATADRPAGATVEPYGSPMK